MLAGPRVLAMRSPVTTPTTHAQGSKPKFWSQPIMIEIGGAMSEMYNLKHISRNKGQKFR